MLQDFLGYALYDKERVFHFLFRAGFWTVRLLGIEFFAKKKFKMVLTRGNLIYYQLKWCHLTRINKKEPTRSEPDVKFIKAK
ncbi:hypothetical protein AWH48_16995 [Domibacillus aminovorans]|uniref:Uncharacterized protein n=1 Tax=Domibacillus aminovorans TaxID=29332 RepID=A0A177KZT2_9BACI|nr:hypothetical protein AWH48_16995 [Domibacillus aminovorans]